MERTFAIVTVEPNETIARIHDRMLAILDHTDVSRWLGPEEDPRDLLRPYPAELLDVSLAKVTKKRRPRDMDANSPRLV
jgi:putative SOS response-associated peptidase YedK